MVRFWLRDKFVTLKMYFDLMILMLFLLFLYVLYGFFLNITGPTILEIRHIRFYIAAKINLYTKLKLI